MVITILQWPLTDPNFRVTNIICALVSIVTVQWRVYATCQRIARLSSALVIVVAVDGLILTTTRACRVIRVYRARISIIAVYLLEYASASKGVAIIPRAVVRIITNLWLVQTALIRVTIVYRALVAIVALIELMHTPNRRIAIVIGAWVGVIAINWRVSTLPCVLVAKVISAKVIVHALGCIHALSSSGITRIVCAQVVVITVNRTIDTAPVYAQVLCA